MPSGAARARALSCGELGELLEVTLTRIGGGAPAGSCWELLEVTLTRIAGGGHRDPPGAA